ncbi:MAG: hypothetical protein JKY65_27765 [Planctomycetes bacterium]|nr:hypothetical protein [Planctomycetota bacterium]
MNAIGPCEMSKQLRRAHDTNVPRSERLSRVPCFAQLPLKLVRRAGEASHSEQQVEPVVALTILCLQVPSLASDLIWPNTAIYLQFDPDRCPVCQGNGQVKEATMGFPVEVWISR